MEEDTSFTTLSWSIFYDHIISLTKGEGISSVAVMDVKYISEFHDLCSFAMCNFTYFSNKNMNGSIPSGSLWLIYFPGGF